MQISDSDLFGLHPISVSKKHISTHVVKDKESPLGCVWLKDATLALRFVSS